MPNTEGYIEEGKKVAKKNRDIMLHGLWGEHDPSPLTPEIYTATGWPAVSTPVLRSLAGKPGAAKKALLEYEGRSSKGRNTQDACARCVEHEGQVSRQWRDEIAKHIKFGECLWLRKGP